MSVLRSLRCFIAVAGSLFAGTAMAAPVYTVSLVTTGDCTSTGHLIVSVKLGVTGGTSTAAGAMIFLNYDGFLTADNTSITVDPSLQPIQTTAGTGSATIAVGVMSSGQTIGNGDTLATIDFTYTGTSCPTLSLVTVDTAHMPVSALTDNAAQSLPFTSSDLAAVTIGDTTAPVITCPSDLTVSWSDGKDPWATGSATAVDACDASPVISYTDDRSGLTACGNIGGRGTLLRTWKATDHCNNFSTCVQTITVDDNTPPAVTGCPADIHTNADANSCSAVVTYASPTAFDQQHFQGFEDAGYVAGGSALQQSTDWNSGGLTTIARVASGTNGIASASGGFHGNLLTTARPSNNAPFTRLGGYGSAFGEGFVVSTDIYIDMADPAIAQNRYTIELTSAASRQDGNHLRDFVFHIQNASGTEIRIAGDNNAYGARRNDFNTAYTNYASITASGWYTLRWTFRDNGSGALACDMQALTSGGSLLFTETRSTPADIIATIVGGNRYMWFTFIDLTNLAIDNTSVGRPLTVSCAPPSGSSFASGTTPVVCSATDACGNVGSCNFNVTVNPFNTLNLTVELAGTASNPANAPFTRCISLDLYRSGPCAFATNVTADVTFTNSTISNAIGTATIDVPCGALYTGITATDPHHTLRRTGTIGTSGVNYQSSFTSALALQGGNINNDSYIDILDFGGFIGQSGTSPGASTTCNPGLHADFSGNGIVSTEDFTFIQSGFLDFRDADPCGGALTGDSPVTDISVDDLVAGGLRAYAMADYNLDGRLNVGDVNWVAQHGLPRCSADFNDDQSIDVQDIFSYLNAWFMAHPKADMNANERTEVQDIFDFINLWFQGC
ncbi:MAG TPA: GC-type dockerin domain-anchored protein [Phycisphaerales bacterium]|nr:GC-type dockerin domain-anchored protein [Phycisphaerales bacterium]